MINFISKVLNIFIHPLGWIIMLLLAAFWFRSRKHKRASHVCGWSSFGLFLLLSNQAFFQLVDDAWCRSQMEEWPKQHYTYCFVPGGLTERYSEKYQTVSYREAVDRMHTAVLFVKEGICDTIVVSGDGASNFNGGNPEGFCNHAARLFDIDSHCIKIERDALTTMQNFQFSLPLLEHGNCITVNSARYMERTRLCADILGFKTDYFSVQYTLDKPDTQFMWVDILPDWNTVNDWHRLLHEWFGCLWYKLLY